MNFIQSNPWIKVALNGGRTKIENPAVPLAPWELAHEAAAAVRAGARAIHFHPRNPFGQEDLAAHHVAESLAAVRFACPGMQVGLTTGGWMFSDPKLRLEVISSWSVCPDFASVNFGEPGAEELCCLLFTRGIAVEAGISSRSDTETFLSSAYSDSCLRVLLEPCDKLVPSALTTTAEMELLLDHRNSTTPRLLHGTGVTAWPLLHEALRRGYLGRIGFEDVLTLPNGILARSNADLLVEAWRLSSSSSPEISPKRRTFQLREQRLS